MRTYCVVVTPPSFDNDLGLAEAVEDLDIQQLVAELRVEALAVTVLQRTTGLDVGRLRTDGVIQSLTALAMNSGPLSERI
jgi:hypothetical protein